MWRELVPALSIANLCYIEVWASLLHPAYHFFRKSPPSPGSIAAALLGVLLLTVLFWAALAVSRRSSSAWARRAGQAVFLLGSVVAGDFVVRHVFQQVMLRLGFYEWQPLFYVFLVVLVVVALVLWLLQDVRLAQVCALVLFPVFLITVGQAGWLLLRPPEPQAFADSPSAPFQTERPAQSQRVLWLLFDEMDFRLAFVQRPESIQLPELDQLQQEAVFAGNAYEANTSTYMSIPSLLSGRRLRNAIPGGLDDMRLVLTEAENGGETTLERNLFSQAHAAGFNAAVVGWYLPYCRLLGSSLVSCSWQTAYLQGERGASVVDLAARQALLMAYYAPSPAQPYLNSMLVTRRLLDLERSYHQDAYQQILAQARAVVVDPRLDLVFVHWPVPHAPAIYDRRRDTFDLRGESSYLDNLELADRTLGEVRRWLEEAGLWDSTVVLVSADHGWKWDYWQTQPLWNEEEAEVAVRLDARVPFLLKLAGQRREFDYSPAFNTVLTKDLLLALLRSQLSAPEEVEAWLDTHRGSVGLRPTDPPR